MTDSQTTYLENLHLMGEISDMPALLWRHYSSMCKIPSYTLFLELDFRFLTVKTVHFGGVYLYSGGAYITGDIQAICKAC